METDLRLANDPVVSEGAFTTHLISSQAAVYYYQNLGNQGQTILTLKDPVERGGEIEKQKYKAVETADYDFQGVDIGTMRMFSADDTYFEKMQLIPVDAAVYKKGVLESTSKFMNATLDELFSYTK